MNRRVLIISIASVLGIALIAGIVWLVLANPFASQQVEGETPAPSGIVVLPSTSSIPLEPSSSPQPSDGPIAFQGICPDTWVGQTDTDTDGLPDAVESTYGTDANVVDTDGDGYTDSEEVRNGYHPLEATSSKRLDSDVDGLLDNEECIWQTDAFNPDSDDDGFQDGSEVSNGYDPTKTGDGTGNDRIGSPPSTPPVGGGFATPFPTQPPVATTRPPVNNPGQPTPIPRQLSTAPLQISLVSFSQLRITSATAPADIKTYLTQVDGLRPQELADGQAISSAIQSAAAGNVEQLASVRSQIGQFSAALKGVSTPKPAQEYHQLYVSLIDFTVQQLATIEQNATGDQAKAAQAVLNIQNTLPSYVTRLSSLRQAVEGASNQ